VGATLSIDMTILWAAMNEMPFCALTLTSTFIRPTFNWMLGMGSKTVGSMFEAKAKAKATVL